MPKNINSSIITDDMIETMKKKVEKTTIIRRELGFNLCKVEDSDVLQDDIHCIGSNCAIRLASDCKTGKKIGSFHTHPRNGDATSNPSLSDLENAYLFGINCVGGVEDKKIRCYVRKDKTVNLKDFSIIKYNKEHFAAMDRPHHVTTLRGLEMVQARFRERDYTRDKLRDHYFNTVDIV